MQPLSIALEQLCSSAADRVVLAAPFAKQAIVARLLGKIAVGVPTDVVVRWLPHDINAGVSDLEVWDVVQAREASRLYVRADLHAKYYRGDTSCLVGSANLTGAALGLSPTPNFELLLAAHAVDLMDFETDLFSAAIEVDEDLVTLTRSAVEQLPRFVHHEVMSDALVGPPEQAIANWIPTLRQPEDLFGVYVGGGRELSNIARLSGEHDLATLRVLPGLGKEAFRAYVAVSLLQMPVISAVDRFIRETRRFGEVADFLRERLNTVEPADRQWQLLFRWLTYFLPERFEYTKPRHSEIIRRRGTGG